MGCSGQMALISCTECGNEVSDKAPACPRCGVPSARFQVQHVIAVQAAPAIIPVIISSAAPTSTDSSAAPNPSEHPIRDWSPSRKAVAAAVVPSVLYAIVIGGLGLLVLDAIADAQVNPSPDQDDVKFVVLGLVALAAAFRVARSFWRAKERARARYVLTNQRLRQATLPNGWEIEVRDIRSVSAAATWFERLLGIGDVTVVAKGRKPCRLFDLEDPASVEDQIRTGVYDATGVRPPLRK
jgi:hypothetical protein